MRRLTYVELHVAWHWANVDCKKIQSLLLLQCCLKAIGVGDCWVLPGVTLKPCDTSLVTDKMGCDTSHT